MKFYEKLEDAKILRKMYTKRYKHYCENSSFDMYSLHYELEVRKESGRWRLKGWRQRWRSLNKDDCEYIDRRVREEFGIGVK